MLVSLLDLLHLHHLCLGLGLPRLVGLPVGAGVIAQGARLLITSLCCRF